jgi:hypothetical protein
MQLPGGISVNGRQIFDDAMNDIKDLEEEWSSKYEQPLGIFIG